MTLRTSLALVLALVPSVASAHQWKSTFYMKERTTFDSLISSLDSLDRDIDAWAVEPDGDWMVVSNPYVWNSAGFDATMVTGVKLNIVFGRTIQAMDCRADGLCVAIHDKGYVSNGTIPSGLWPTLSDWINTKHWAVRDFELSGSYGWMLLGPGDVAAYSGLDSDLSRAIYDRRSSGRSIADVAIDFDGHWALLADNNPMFESIPVGLESRLGSVARGEVAADRILLGRNGDWVVFNADDDYVSPDLTDPIQAIEYNLGGGKNIWQRMQDYGVVGLSIAVIDDDEVVYARGYGRARESDDRAVLASTPYDVASLSKYIGALTTLATLEDYPSLDLDDDAVVAAGSGGTVEAWKDRIADEKGAYGFPGSVADVPSGLTFRRLLSHTAGMVTRGSTPIPSALQSSDGNVDTLSFLSGWACDDGTTCDWDSSHSVYWDSTLGSPGRNYNYSNAGLYLTQAALEDITGDEGSRLMRDHVFSPLGLSNTTADYPLPASFLSRVAGHHDADGELDQTTYPWSFAGGVTSSVEDYAEMVIVGLNGGLGSDGTRILSDASWTQLLQRVNYATYATSPTKNNYALGLGVSRFGADGNVKDADGVFRHTGSHPSRVNTYMCGNPSRGEGLVIFMNTQDDLASGAGGVTDFETEIRSAFDGVFGWPTGC